MQLISNEVEIHANPEQVLNFISIPSHIEKLLPLDKISDFKSDEYPVMDTPGVYYKNAINEINEFWEEFGGQEYFNEDWIQMIIQEMHYELPSEKWKKLYPKVKKASIVRKKNEEVLSEYFPNDIADKISRLSVFGKKSKVRSKKKVDSELVYLRKFL